MLYCMADRPFPLLMVAGVLQLRCMTPHVSIGSRLLASAHCISLDIQEQQEEDEAQVHVSKESGPEQGEPPKLLLKQRVIKTLQIASSQPKWCFRPTIEHHHHHTSSLRCRNARPSKRL